MTLAWLPEFLWCQELLSSDPRYMNSPGLKSQNRVNILLAEWRKAIGGIDRQIS